jgi:hypothetical protein
MLTSMIEKNLLRNTRRRKRIDIRSRLDCYFLSGCVNRFFFRCTPWVECGIIVYTVTDFVILLHRLSRIGRKIIGDHVSYDKENDLNSPSLFYLHEFSDSFFSTIVPVSSQCRSGVTSIDA